jgi:hypothetical protein
VVASSHTDEENFKAAALEASSAAAQAEREASSIGSDWCQVRIHLLLFSISEIMPELFEFTIKNGDLIMMNCFKKSNNFRLEK